jgi:uncharacterized protein
MSATSEDRPTSLPRQIPIFPLTGALLLPLGRLPLNIFEPRYLAMFEDALKGSRIIGMVQPQEIDGEARMENPPVYRTGCAGRITSFRETRDNRYEIVLDGFSRFDIVQESETPRGYRIASVNWDRFAADLDTSDDPVLDLEHRERLVASLDKFLTSRGANLKGTGISSLSERELLAAVSMSCPFRANEKQALLEAEKPEACADLLISLLEMAAFEHDGDRISRQ